MTTIKGREAVLQGKDGIGWYIICRTDRRFFLSKHGEWCRASWDSLWFNTEADALAAIERFADPPGEAIECGCAYCLDQLPADGYPIKHSRRMMVLCQKCGNKRCPHATYHGHRCTTSNKPGQPGGIQSSVRCDDPACPQCAGRIEPPTVAAHGERELPSPEDWLINASADDALTEAAEDYERELLKWATEIARDRNSYETHGDGTTYIRISLRDAQAAIAERLRADASEIERLRVLRNALNEELLRIGQAIEDAGGERFFNPCAFIVGQAAELTRLKAQLAASEERCRRLEEVCRKALLIVGAVCDGEEMTAHAVEQYDPLTVCGELHRVLSTPTQASEAKGAE